MTLNINGALCIANDSAVATSQTAAAIGDYFILGLGGVASATGNKTTIIFNNQGWAAPSNANATSNGDKLVFWNDSNGTISYSQRRRRSIGSGSISNRRLFSLRGSFYIGNV